MEAGQNRGEQRFVRFQNEKALFAFMVLGGRFFHGVKGAAAGSRRTTRMLLTIYGSQQMESIFSLDLGETVRRVAQGQLAAAGLAPFIDWNRFDEVNATRHLPTA